MSIHETLEITQLDPSLDPELDAKHDHDIDQDFEGDGVPVIEVDHETTPAPPEDFNSVSIPLVSTIDPLQRLLAERRRARNQQVDDYTSVRPSVPMKPESLGECLLRAKSLDKFNKEIMVRVEQDEPGAIGIAVEGNMKLALFVMNNTLKGRNPDEDIIQVAYVGLVKAVRRFDNSRGLNFSTYAVQKIMGEVKHYLRDYSGGLRVPRSLKECMQSVSNTIGDFESRGEPWALSQIAKELKLTEAEVLTAMQASQESNVLSLDRFKTGSNEEVLLGDMIEDRKAQETFDRTLDKALLSSTISKLPKRLQFVVDAYYFGYCTQAEIGEFLGVSKMQVSRILKQATQQLKELLQLGEAT